MAKAPNPNQVKQPEVPKKPNPEVPKRRVRFLMVNPNDFLLLFVQGMVFAKRAQLITGCPADAKLLNMTVDHVRGGIMLLVQSDEYEEIPQTEMPPVQLVEIQLGVIGATKKKKK